MSIDSGAIDLAVLDVLNSDPALLALLPDGAYLNLAKQGVTAYALVSLADSADALSFEGRAFERNRYLVKAVVLSTRPDARATARQAAARIDALLDPQPPDPRATLDVPPYTLMATLRDPESQRIHHDEQDAIDPSIRFYHRGGHYLVVMSTP